MGRKGAWGGREYGAEGSLGRMGALGGPTDRRGFQPALAPNCFRNATRGVQCNTSEPAQTFESVALVHCLVCTPGELTGELTQVRGMRRGAAYAPSSSRVICQLCMWSHLSAVPQASRSQVRDGVIDGETK